MKDTVTRGWAAGGPQIPGPSGLSVRAATPWPEPEASELPPPRAWTREEAEAWAASQPRLSPWHVVGAQAVAGLVCGGLVGVVTQHGAAAGSALYGAAAVVVPSALLARGMTKRTRHPAAAAAGFMFWEMVKLGLTVAMLAVAAKVVPGLSWPALLVAMVVCIKVHWLALLWRGRRTGRSEPKDGKAEQRDGS